MVPTSLAWADIGMRLASIGLDEYEQGLLAQQLRVLAGRTAAPWLYLGEAQVADLLIVRDPRLLDAGSRGLCVQAGMPAQAGELQLDWPPRMFALLELLLAAERRLEVVVDSEQCMAEQLAALRQEGWLQVGEQRVFVQPRADRLAASVADLESLLALLEGATLPLQIAPAGEAVDVLPLQVSLQAVIWALALRSGTHCVRRWDARQLQFRLAAWPHFGEWQSSPALLRLAALYSRQPASIADGCQRAAVDEAQVRGFLLACELCKVGVGIEYVQAPAAVAAQRIEPAAPVGLLQRLRERLGLGLARSR